LTADRTVKNINGAGRALLFEKTTACHIFPPLQASSVGEKRTGENSWATEAWVLGRAMETRAAHDGQKDQKELEGDLRVMESPASVQPDSVEPMADRLSVTENLA
jgi:hypothetical protein